MANDTGGGGSGSSGGVQRRRENIRNRNEEIRQDVIKDLRKEIADLETRRDTRRRVRSDTSNRAADEYQRQIDEIAARVRAIEVLPISEQEIWDDDDIRATPPARGGGGSSGGNGASGSWGGPPSPPPGTPSWQDPVGAALGEAERNGVGRPPTAAPAPTAAPVTDQAVAATAPAPAPANLGGTPNPDGKFGIPGGHQVWEGPDNFWYAVYTVPGTNPPVPMAWRIENDDDVAAIFGAGNEWRTDRKLNADEWKAAGVLTFGSSRNLANTSEHPFDAFVNNFATEAAVRPWLRDPEILALTTRAILENRTVTDAELSGTEWWRTRTEGERQWIATFNTDPKTAQQKIQDSRDSVRKLMITAGIGNPPDRLVQLIGDRMTAGTWSQQYVQNQVMKVADPAAPGDLDPTLGTWLNDLNAEGVQLNTLADNTSKVEKLVRTWLGPAFGKSGWTQDQMQMWSGRLRNDPNAEEELTKHLSDQRMVLFPQYTDPTKTYDDIASTWRAVVQNTWGEAADETDPMFLEIVKTNDLAVAQQMLRRTGRERGVKKVVDETLSDMGKAFPSIRRSA